MPVVNIAVDYILKRAGAAPDQLPSIVAGIDLLPSISRREQALRECADQFGVPVADWWEGRQFHVMSAAEIGDADSRGLDIQLHTHRHRSSDTGSDNLAREIADNRAALAKACGKPDQSFSHFCYPSGVGHSSAIAILKKFGVKSATLGEDRINPRGTDPYRLRRLLDGRAISDAVFEAYLSGSLEVRSALKGAAQLLRRSWAWSA